MKSFYSLEPEMVINNWHSMLIALIKSALPISSRQDTDGGKIVKCWFINMDLEKS